jgi:hypothetical protein
MAKTPNDMVVGMITVKNSKDGYWNTALQPVSLILSKRLFSAIWKPISSFLLTKCRGTASLFAKAE